MTFVPAFTYSNATVRSLAVIERARELVENTSLPANAALQLVSGARLRSTHHSTRIEGNPLSQLEVRQAVARKWLSAARERHDAAKEAAFWKPLEDRYASGGIDDEFDQTEDPDYATSRNASLRAGRENSAAVAQEHRWAQRAVATSEAAIARAKLPPTGSSRDFVQEVRNYWRALEWLEEQASRNATLTEKFIRQLHAIVMASAKRGRPRKVSDYRHWGARPFAVIDTATGLPVYVPPNPDLVRKLMPQLVAWFESAEAMPLPVPVRAAILAYQFVTIHPFDDGNGRMCRALATFALWRGGYAMKGMLSVEEFYGRDRDAYYAALQMGLPVEYDAKDPQGRPVPCRARCDLSPWIGYFTGTLADAAELVTRAVAAAGRSAKGDETAWEQLSLRQRQVLIRLSERIGIFAKMSVATDTSLESIDLASVGGTTVDTRDLAEWFGISPKTARQWLHEWRDAGFLDPAAGTKLRVRGYQLAPRWEQVARERAAEAVAAVSATVRPRRKQLAGRPPK